MGVAVAFEAGVGVAVVDGVVVVLLRTIPTAEMRASLLQPVNSQTLFKSSSFSQIIIRGNSGRLLSLTSVIENSMESCVLSE